MKKECSEHFQSIHSLIHNDSVQQPRRQDFWIFSCCFQGFTWHMVLVRWILGLFACLLICSLFKQQPFNDVADVFFLAKGLNPAILYYNLYFCRVMWLLSTEGLYWWTVLCMMYRSAGLWRLCLIPKKITIIILKCGVNTRGSIFSRVVLCAKKRKSDAAALPSSFLGLLLAVVRKWTHFFFGKP